MHFLKRALISITRRKLKSAILLLIVLILGVIMLSTLLIVQSVDSTRESILRELPPAVSLMVNYEKLEEFFKDHYQGPVDFEMPWITFDDLERIETAAGHYIRTYDYSSSTGFETESLELYSHHDDNERVIVRPGGGNHFNLRGVNTPEFTLLAVGDAKIIEGRSFTREEIESGKPVLVINKDLAELNNLFVGDIVEIESQFTDYSDEGEHIIFDTLLLEFEIIGLLEYRELPGMDDHFGIPQDDYMKEQYNRTLYTSNRFVASYMEMAMDIYVPYYKEKYGEDFFGRHAEYNPLAGVPVTYILNSSEEVGSFVKIAEAALDNEYHHFVTQEDNYKKVAEPLESMKGILTYAFFITVGSAIFVLALVMFGFMRERQKEIGIYLALGEKKSRITAQMTFESIAVGLVGATLAVICGMFVASFISDMLITMPQADPRDVFMRYPVHAGGYFSDISYDSIMQNYKVGITFLSAVYFYIAITATIVAAQLLASIYILRFDPKKILM